MLAKIENREISRMENEYARSREYSKLRIMNRREKERVLRAEIEREKFTWRHSESAPADKFPKAIKQIAFKLRKRDVYTRKRRGRERRERGGKEGERLKRASKGFFQIRADASARERTREQRDARRARGMVVRGGGGREHYRETEKPRERDGRSARARRAEERARRRECQEAEAAV